MPVEQMESISAALRAGFHVVRDATEEVIADNGAKIFDITTKEVIAGNGAASEMGQIVEFESAAATVGTTTSAGLFAIELPTACVAAAAALGLAIGGVAGSWLYDLDQSFWDDLGDKLFAAGVTIKGKVAALLDANGKTSLPEAAIEAIKEMLISRGLFDPTTTISEDDFVATPQNVADFITNGFDSTGAYSNVVTRCQSILGNKNGRLWANDIFARISQLPAPSAAYAYNYLFSLEETGGSIALETFPNSLNTTFWTDHSTQGGLDIFTLVFASMQLSTKYLFRYTIGSTLYPGDVWVIENVLQVDENYLQQTSQSNIWASLWQGAVDATQGFPAFALLEKLGKPNFQAVALPNIGTTEADKHMQPGAVPPTEDPFPETYPTWQPMDYPEEIPTYYPVSLPTPDAGQDPAQGGENAKDDQIQQILDNVFNPQPEPSPQPEPQPDPDPSPEPDPEPDPEGAEQKDPVDPNPDPEGSGLTPIIPPLSGITATRMYTVYNPTDGQINSLGAYLWTSNIIEQIRQMWDDPMGAIISLHKIYAPPVTGSLRNIVLGYLDSGVDALEVTNQFTTVDCGSVDVDERKRNATDYTPFVKGQLYLPFVGIVEIDIDEIMNGSIHVVYKVDAYTGVCLALVYVQRDADMSNEQLLYTFSGNASQTVPLTNINYSGAMSALLGLAGAGISVATGGAIGVATGAISAAHSLTHEMVHYQHSGGISANAGIMAPRKPALILTRQQGYDANGYNSLYGYPANKTVYLSNCIGYVHVKDIRYKGDGTEEEKNEIIRLLKEGVIVQDMP